LTILFKCHCVFILTYATGLPFIRVIIVVVRIFHYCCRNRTSSTHASCFIPLRYPRRVRSSVAETLQRRFKERKLAAFSRSDRLTKCQYREVVITVSWCWRTDARRRGNTTTTNDIGSSSSSSLDADALMVGLARAPVRDHA